MDNKPNPFAPAFKDLPEIIPIFPLSGVMLLPHGNLPLNIFEPRYLAMVEKALAGNRMIGMVQPQKSKNQSEIKDVGVRPVFQTGCVGKITEFTETKEGRYHVTLSGICRFDIEEELEPHKDGFRRVKPSWTKYEKDLDAGSCVRLDREKLKALLKQYFEKEEMICDWQAFENAPDVKLITCLSMICPLGPCEKQALLEAVSCDERAEKFFSLLEMATCCKGHKSEH